MEVIKKNLKVSPNLPIYDDLCHNFRWQDHLSDIPLFPDGTFNAGYAITDWKLEEKKDKTAILWENDRGENKTLTFSDLSKLSNKFANILIKYGIQKGDRVFTFLPRIPEIYYIFPGILKTGAVGGNFFPAFGKEALFDRLKNSGAKILVTTSILYPRVKEIWNELPNLAQVILTDCGDGSAKVCDLPYQMSQSSDQFESVHCDLIDPLFMLFTSATGNTPISGIVTPNKALLQEYYTAKWVLDLQNNDIYWCTADPGWVTGTVYGILAPLMCGITQLVYDGRFSADAWYSLIQKYKVSVWYTAPTAIRMLATEEEKVKNYNLTSLRHIVSVGEALNPSSIEWSMKNYSLPIHDTYWQTETGAMMITNYPALDIKVGSMGKPIPGIEAAIIDDDGNQVPDETEGNLAFKKGWPGMLIDVWQNPSAYSRYFTPPSIADSHDSRGTSYFYTGDRAKRDNDGYYWFIGRANDVIKTSGERVGPFEVESAINKHPKVHESGVIGKPDELRGQIIKAFIVLKPGETADDTLKDEIQQFVKKQLAGHAYPREIEFVSSLPKNRSGKIVRRILKARELGESLGDTSTLTESY